MHLHIPYIVTQKIPQQAIPRKASNKRCTHTHTPVLLLLVVVRVPTIYMYVHYNNIYLQLQTFITSSSSSSMQECHLLSVFLRGAGSNFKLRAHVYTTYLTSCRTAYTISESRDAIKCRRQLQMCSYAEHNLNNKQPFSFHSS